MGTECGRGRLPPYVWFQPVSRPQHTGYPQNVHELHGGLRVLLLCAVHLSQQSWADLARWPTPKLRVLPPRSECGSCRRYRTKTSAATRTHTDMQTGMHTRTHAHTHKHKTARTRIHTSPQVSAVATPGQSPKQLISSSLPLQIPSPQHF